MDLVGSAGRSEKLFGPVLGHRPAASHLEKPMTTTTHDVENGTDSRILSGPRHNHLGVDQEGDAHYWNRATDTVTVITPAGERTYQYETDDVSHWVCYVADRRGWDNLRFVDLRDFTAEEALL